MSKPLPCIHRSEDKTGIAVLCWYMRGRTHKIRQPVHECSLFTRCLPYLGRWQDRHKDAEDQLYHLCAGCTERKEE